MVAWGLKVRVGARMSVRSAPRCANALLYLLLSFGESFDQSFFNVFGWSAGDGLFGGRSLRQAMTLFSGDRCEMLPRAALASAGGSIHPDERQCMTIA